MSAGLEALEHERWEDARAALERAGRIRPDAREVADGLARVAAGLRREEIAGGTRRAVSLEASETWHEAEEAYAAVLAIDPEAAAALAGRERSAARADLDDKLEYHLGNPRRLSSPSVLEDAAALLEEAETVTPRGPRLTAQLRRLEELIEIASTPVRVVIESDSLTDIVIFHVGRLGTFARHELNLRPGIYTAVGSRAGFRDVRVRFEVVPGNTEKPVVVRCTESL
jgi:tetratricopeptide (TPR) repeat protein